jgi:hypothetical protein
MGTQQQNQPNQQTPRPQPDTNKPGQSGGQGTNQPGKPGSQTTHGAPGQQQPGQNKPA